MFCPSCKPINIHHCTAPHLNGSTVDPRSQVRSSVMLVSSTTENWQLRKWDSLQLQTYTPNLIKIRSRDETCGQTDTDTNTHTLPAIYAFNSCISYKEHLLINVGKNQSSIRNRSETHANPQLTERYLGKLWHRENSSEERAEIYYSFV
jgi:hypothetical protein